MVVFSILQEVLGGRGASGDGAVVGDVEARLPLVQWRDVLLPVAQDLWTQLLDMRDAEVGEWFLCGSVPVFWCVC